jgi:hypothetical protein
MYIPRFIKIIPMRTPLHALTVFLLFSIQAQSQEPKRIIIDLETNQPVPYATVKVLHTNLGKIASANGAFMINIRPGDSVLITSVGYRDTILIGKNIGDSIALTPRPKVLESVFIKTRKVIRKYIIGNGADLIEKTIRCNAENGGNDNCMIWAYGAAAEFAEPMLLPDSSKAYHLSKVFIPLTYMNCWQPIFLQIYERDSATGGPGTIIFKKRILFQSEVYKKGKIIIDVREEDIFFDKLNTYFISMSWVADDFDHHCLTGLVMIKSRKGICYSRTLQSLDYHWFLFDGHSKKQKETPGRFHTLFAAEIEELQE